MFLSRLGERSGLFGILAPRKEPSSDKVLDAWNDQQDGEPNGDIHDEASPVNDDRESQVTAEKDFHEDHLEKRRLDYQQKMEAEAESRGAFAKKQRVKYHNKLQGRWDDAVIVGVHHDDGPDKPYYTIHYRKEETDVDSNGQPDTIWIDVEKQTTPDRLKRVPFDPEASWELLK